MVAIHRRLAAKIHGASCAAFGWEAVGDSISPRLGRANAIPAYSIDRANVRAIALKLETDEIRSKKQRK